MNTKNKNDALIKLDFFIGFLLYLTPVWAFGLGYYLELKGLI